MSSVTRKLAIPCSSACSASRSPAWRSPRPPSGTAGNEVLRGSDGPDQFYGEAGADTLLALRGDDYVEGDPGGDALVAGPGVDLLIAGAGNDSIRGDAGQDGIYAGHGDDAVSGAAVILRGRFARTSFRFVASGR